MVFKMNQVEIITVVPFMWQRSLSFFVLPMIFFLRDKFFFLIYPKKYFHYFSRRV